MGQLLPKNSQIWAELAVLPLLLAGMATSTCSSGESVSQKAIVGMLAYAASAMAWWSVRGSVSSSRRGSRDLEVIWLVKVPGVKRPAMGEAPVYWQYFRIDRCPYGRAEITRRARLEAQQAGGKRKKNKKASHAGDGLAEDPPTDDDALDDPVAEKARRQRLVEEADLRAARELFGSNLLTLTWIKGEPLTDGLVGDILRAVSAHIDGEAAMTGPEGRHVVGPVADKRHPHGLQNLTRSRQIEDQFRTGTDNSNRCMCQFKQIGRDIHTFGGAAMYPTNSPSGK